jgi:hypothetical protein
MWSDPEVAAELLKKTNDGDMKIAAKSKSKAKLEAYAGSYGVYNFTAQAHFIVQQNIAVTAEFKNAKTEADAKLAVKHFENYKTEGDDRFLYGQMIYKNLHPPKGEKAKPAGDGLGKIIRTPGDLDAIIKELQSKFTPNKPKDSASACPAGANATTSLTGTLLTPSGQSAPPSSGPGTLA